MLEVIEQNPRAVALYRRHGFQEITQLLGWRRKPLSPGATAETACTMDELPILDALRMPASQEYPDLPWQISRHAIVKLERTAAFSTGRVCAVVSDPGATPIRLHALMSDSRGQAGCRELLRALIHRFAEREFRSAGVAGGIRLGGV